MNTMIPHTEAPKKLKRDTLTEQKQHKKNLTIKNTYKKVGHFAQLRGHWALIVSKTMPFFLLLKSRQIQDLYKGTVLGNKMK